MISANYFSSLVFLAVLCDALGLREQADYISFTCPGEELYQDMTRPDLKGLALGCADKITNRQ